jgi:hypothetical protein
MRENIHRANQHIQEEWSGQRCKPVVRACCQSPTTSSSNEPTNKGWEVALKLIKFYRFILALKHKRHHVDNVSLKKRVRRC